MNEIAGEFKEKSLQPNDEQIPDFEAENIKPDTNENKQF